MGKSLGLVVLGAGGYMGSTAIRAAGPLCNLLASEGVTVKVLFVADTNSESWSTAASLCKECTTQLPIAVARLQELLPLLRAVRGGDDNPVIVYDASPSSRHYAHLLTVLQHSANGVFYLGEKPIFLDLHQKQAIQDTPEGFNFFCELIETENPVFKKVSEYLLNTPDIQIERLWFWRAGASGIKKAICAGRDGVEGGALEDKSLHDFSISLGLLGGPDKVVNATVTEAKIHHLVLSKNYYFQQKKEFLTARNESTPRIHTDLETKGDLPADGLFSAHVEWEVMDGADSRSIPAEYVFSWVGYVDHPKEHAIITRLKQLGFPGAADNDSQNSGHRWLDSSSICGSADPREFGDLQDDPTFRADLQEIRIGIIDCGTPRGKLSIVCNFLAKYGSIQRFACVVDQEAGVPKMLYSDDRDLQHKETTYEMKKETDVARVLYAVARHATGHVSPKLIGRRATLLVHDLMLNAQEQAIKSLVAESTDPNYWFEKTVAVFDKHITKVNEPATKKQSG